MYIIEPNHIEIPCTLRSEVLNCSSDSIDTIFDGPKINKLQNGQQAARALM